MVGAKSIHTLSLSSCLLSETIISIAVTRLVLLLHRRYDPIPDLK